MLHFGLGLAIIKQMWANAVTVPPIFNLPLQNTLIPSVAAGSSTPTFTRASAANYEDWENVLRGSFADSVPRFVGGRSVANYVNTKSEDWTVGIWSKTIGTVTATTLTSTGANQTVLQPSPNRGNSVSWVLQVRMSRITGTGNIQLSLDNISWTTVTLTGAPQIFSISQTISAATTFGIRIVTSGDAINADRIQLEDVTAQSNTNPGEYVSVGVLATPWNGAGADGVKYFTTKNGNTVASNVVTTAAGVAINTTTGANVLVADATGPVGYLSEFASQNLWKWSEDLSDLTWAKVDATVTADSVAAPTGYPTADKVKEVNTNAVHQVYELQTLTAVKYAVSSYFKQAERTWTFFSFTDTIEEGAYADLANGVLGTISANFTAAIKAAASGFYRVVMTRTATAATWYLKLESSTGNNVNSFVGTTGSGFHAYGMQVELQGFPTSYIYSDGLQRSRNADVLQYVSASNLPGTNFSVVGETQFPFVPSTASYFLWATYVDANNYTAVLWDGTNLIARRRIAGVNNDATIALVPISTTIFKWAARFSSTTGTDIFKNGVAGTNQATNTAPQIGANFQIGANGNSGNQAAATVRNFRIYDVVLTNTQILAL